MDRRSFLRKMMALAPSAGYLTLSSPAMALDSNPVVMYITREETGDTRSMIMTPDNALSNYLALCWLGRDVRRNDVRPLDPQLLDRWWSLYGVLYRAVGFTGHFVLHSGYRSSATNREVGGAVNSWHKRGGALDFHADGINMYALSEFVRLSHHGGVGYYARNNESRGWMHMDVGDQRYWKG